jgi:hypothetical protein
MIDDELNEEIFADTSEAVAIVWWLVYLLGGRVDFPKDQEFWLDNFPTNTVLIRRFVDGKSLLIAETQD